MCGKKIKKPLGCGFGGKRVPEKRVRDLVSREDHVPVLEELVTEKVAESVVFFVEVEDGGGRVA